LYVLFFLSKKKDPSNPRLTGGQGIQRDCGKQLWGAFIHSSLGSSNSIIDFEILT
jgi:hypothetical protein